jgi:hypothetical protein
MPREVFVAGQILTAAEMNVVSDQSVMSFADSSARTTAIPSPVEGMVSYLADVNRLQVFTTDWEDVKTGFTASATITASNASWPVPALRSPFVKVTVIGGGGGGGASVVAGSGGSGGDGGTTTFDAAGAGSVTAAGGIGGTGGSAGTSRTGTAGLPGFTSGNAGTAGNSGETPSPNRSWSGSNGTGGAITVAYLNLTGISTVDVTIGGGGAAGTGSRAGGVGGRGEVIVEYVAVPV